MNYTQTELNVSLEPHLADALSALSPILPHDLKSKLEHILTRPSQRIISYSLIQSISKWSRTPSGTAAISALDLDSQAYSMIALLAGTTTSPERQFPASVVKEQEDLITERDKERKAITALLNALLSVIGSGVATWWAAEVTGWKAEWRVLFSLFIAVLVAISEAVLYIVWQSRKQKTKSRKRLLPQDKKDDGYQLATDSAPVTLDSNTGQVTMRHWALQPTIEE